MGINYPSPPVAAIWKLIKLPVLSLIANIEYFEFLQSFYKDETAKRFSILPQEIEECV